MKKAVTVFLILTPIAFLLWLTGMCFLGVMSGQFVTSLGQFMTGFESLFKAPAGIRGWISLFVLIFGLVTFVLFLIIPPIRKKPAYMWLAILSILTIIPTCGTLIHYHTLIQPELESVEVGHKILGWAIVIFAALTSICYGLLWLLSTIEIAKHPGPTVKEEIASASEEAKADDSALTDEPESEPVEEEKDPYEPIRMIVREELERVLDQLQAKENVRIRMLEEEIERLKAGQPVEEKPIEDEIIEEEKPTEEVIEQIIEEVVEEQKPEEEVVIVPPVEEAKPEKVYERISFVQRMIDADDEMKDHYNELKNEILSYGVKSRVSSSGDAFRLHTKTYVKITIAGKSLKLYFALDPKDYENTKLPISDAGHKGIYAEIPLVFKVKSGLSMKRAKELIADAMAKDNLEKTDISTEDWVSKLEEDLEASFDDDEE